MALTGGASPSSDVAKVVVRQNLVGGGQRGELNVAVQGGAGGQSQQSNVISEIQKAKLLAWIPDALQKPV